MFLDYKTIILTEASDTREMDKTPNNQKSPPLYFDEILAKNLNPIDKTRKISEVSSEKTGNIIV